MTNCSQHKKAVLCTLLGYIIWGCSFLFSRVALQILPLPMVVLTLRFVTAFVMMNLLVLCGAAQLRLRGKNLRPLLLLALTEPLCFFFESYGILYSNATFAGAMSAVSPIAAILMAAVFLKERPSRHMLVWCLIPIVGAVILAVAGKDLGIVGPLGVFFLVGFCLASAAYKTANRGSSAEFTPFERFYAVLTACVVVFTPIGVYQASQNVAAVKAALGQPKFLWALAMLILLCSLAANLLVNYGAARLSVGVMATMGAIQTVCASVSGVLLLNEPVSVWLVVGTVLIIFGVYMASREEEHHGG